MSLSPQISTMEFTTPVRSSTYPPTSVPRPTIKRASTAPERRPKLRASCDACAASKVKCSKEHPICARCSANGSQCIYGISRKHGKPGRTRKRNPDGTPFIKASKQRPSPDGSEFGKFRVRPEPIIHQSLPEFDTISNWSSNWSNPPSLRATPEFEFEMTPEPIYMEPTDFSFMDDLLMPIPAPQFEPIHQTIETEQLTFRDPFAKKQSIQLDLPDIQALKDFIGGDSVNPLDYTFAEANMVSYFSDDSSLAASSAPQSPKTTPHLNPLRVSVSMPTNSCCSPVAYSTLESLRIIGPDANNGTPTTELKNLDTVLSITKSAVKNVLQLLQCPCSSQPHLAMLYSSIVSKILTWYQIAAGVKPTPPPAAPPSLSSGSSSPSSSIFSSPLSTPGSEMTSFNIQVQPLRFGVYEFDELDQEIFRRQVILRELKKCSQVVEALANWRRDGQPETEQAEFLYDVLGAWLKSELYKTLREVEGIDMEM